MTLNSKPVEAAVIITLLFGGALVVAYGTAIPANSLILTLAAVVITWACALGAMRSRRSPSRR